MRGSDCCVKNTVRNIINLVRKLAYSTGRSSNVVVHIDWTTALWKGKENLQKSRNEWHERRILRWVRRAVDSWWDRTNASDCEVAPRIPNIVQPARDHQARRRRKEGLFLRRQGVWSRSPSVPCWLVLWPVGNSLDSQGRVRDQISSGFRILGEPKPARTLH
jgi:hypothetical protein